MEIQLEVEVKIRKGLGPDYIMKSIPVFFDDLPEGTTKYEMESMAAREIDEQLSKTEDFPQYGKNWEITNYNYT